MRELIEREYYKHFKGNWYYVYGKAIHSESDEELVVYRAMYGDKRLSVRPLEMFLEEADKKKYPSCQYKYRFTSRKDLNISLEEVKKEIEENSK